MLDLSVVVVSYNTRALLRACLDSVHRSLAAGSTTAEVWVVDNASTDDSPAMVRQDFPQFRLIANQANLGFAAANNQALRQAQGRHFLLQNPDTEVLGHALSQLVSFMDALPQAGAAGGQLLHPNGSPQHSAFRFPTLAQVFFDFFPLNHRLVDSRLNGRYPWKWYNQPFRIDHPLGACLMVRREAAEQVGLLDEGFFMYCEEIDWCIRLQRAGWQVWFTPTARIVHHVAQSTQQVHAPMLVELHRSRFRLFAKHYSAGFQRWARRIVRLGLHWQRLRDWGLVHRGRMPEQERAERLAAYRQIEHL